MAFPEKTKNEVKRKSHHKCCLCRNVIIDVHHIIPQKDGGGDEIENAAPLCPTCHEQFGDNPSKRKAIIECRDIWYELCEKSEMYPGYEAFSNKLDSIYREFQKFGPNQVKQNKYLKELTIHVSEYFTDRAATIAKASTFSELLVESGIALSGSHAFTSNESEPRKCNNCQVILVDEKVKYCSNCGNKI